MLTLTPDEPTARVVEYGEMMIEELMRLVDQLADARVDFVLYADADTEAECRAALESALAAPAEEPIGEVVIGEAGDTKGWTLVRWRSDLPPVPVGTKLYASPALAAPAAEPVAWATMPDAVTWDFVSGPDDPNGRLPGKWEPLYASAPQRRPLTDAAIERLWAVAEPLPKRPGQAGHAAIALNFARRVEREHGIE